MISLSPERVSALVAEAVERVFSEPIAELRGVPMNATPLRGILNPRRMGERPYVGGERVARLPYHPHIS